MSRKEAHKSALLEKGLEGPTNWYKAHVGGLNKEDGAKIPQEAYTITIPTFFLGSLKDKVGIVDLMKSSTEMFCSDLKVSGALDVGHFIMLEDPGEDKLLSRSCAGALGQSLPMEMFLKGLKA
ncbi:hypothetical protein D9757_011700 [Collybiopsis confluens]|uniref:Uncharacterized protein n=1 Tax=Collybiopsis confluens TaxID=2823264 RepID=A0A8H5GLP3_9AGAR|nr:hypothetical protein D9757_011700 [Collybiopsis confluens]